MVTELLNPSDQRSSIGTRREEKFLRIDDELVRHFAATPR